MKLALLLDLYELTMAQSYFLYKKNKLATFELFVRELPPRRNYLVGAGLETILGYIKRLKFTPDDLSYLKAQKIFTMPFLRYLKKFKFSGDIWAIREGEIFFANEPIIRVTAPLIEAQLLESFFLNTVNIEAMIASKAARVVSAASGKKVYDFSLRRTHGQDAGIKAARSAYLAGVSATSCVLAAKLYQIPVVGTMAHSFVMSFAKEGNSFLAYARTFPDKTTLLVDTYDVKKGIENAIEVGLYLKRRGHRLQGIRLDSGDIVSLSKFAREKLDRAGLGFVKIIASGNLDEFRIKALLKRGARVDSFGVGTNMGTSSDSPSLDVIYKLTEVGNKEGEFFATMKISTVKVTYPGRKQVFRICGKKGKFIRDIIALEGEKINGRPLLKKVVDKGEIIYQTPALEKVREFCRRNLDGFAQEIRNLSVSSKYPVLISPGLKQLKNLLSKQLEERQ